ncbi:hypothetical protein [uncultured Pelagimonas sp.]|uniref:hypothetical protein n=1 Tax=uncultured Pelagimonas sp. TaxID=1618102 RepID=UPI00262F3E0B|nr:hypothetical protein [uncultured Pelagimonas sp.]
MFLADKASDDGSDIWCSKGTIRQHTELGETTVKRTIRAFLQEGILVETGKRRCKNGFTVVYQIDLGRVRTLQPITGLDTEMESSVGPVLTEPRMGGGVTEVLGSPRPPNHPKTIHKPPMRERVAVEDELADKVLAVYPSDRQRGKADCLRKIRAALDEGVSPKDFMDAVKAYATESADFTRSKVCFSDNWFKSERWRAYVGDITKGREERKAKEAEMLAGLANWIAEKHALCRLITPSQIDALLASKLVTKAQIRAAGLKI